MWKWMLFVVCLTGCAKVEPGYVGIKVNLYGTQRGIDDFPIQTGRVWYNPFTTDVYKFPTYVQTVSWTKNKDEDSPNDDSITFNADGGAEINADVALEYQFESDKVPSIFVEYKRNAKEFTWEIMRKRLRDVMNTIGGKHKAIEIMAIKKKEDVHKVAEANKALAHMARY